MKKVIQALLITIIGIGFWILSVSLFKMYKFPDWVNVIYSFSSYLICIGSAGLIAFKISK